MAQQGSVQLPSPDEVVELETGDKHRFSLNCFHGERVAGAPVFLIWPAMGTRARNYHLLALGLRERGFVALIGELRGHGSSSMRAKHGTDYGYTQMLGEDWETALAYAESHYPGQPVYLLGHSLGGQLSLLFASANTGRISGVVLVASCSVYYKCFGSKAWALRLSLPVVWALVKVLGYFPGDSVGFARTESPQVMHDWAYQARTGRYRPTGDDHEYEYLLTQLAKPILALELENDRLAPSKAVNHLLGKLKSAQIKRSTCSSREPKGNGHFTWMKDPGQIVAQIDAWQKSHR